MADPTQFPLRYQLYQIVREWTVLADTWEFEERSHTENSVTFIVSTRVTILRRCRDVIANALEAFPDA